MKNCQSNIAKWKRQKICVFQLLLKYAHIVYIFIGRYSIKNHHKNVNREAKRDSAYLYSQPSGGGDRKT
jgi:hypothetical protein